MSESDDRAAILMSSADLKRARRTPPSPEAPAISDIVNGASGQVIVRAERASGAKAYEVLYALAQPGQPPGAWQPGGLFTNPRSMPVNRLIPSSRYSFRLRAVRGDGFSGWSEAVTVVVG